MSANEIGIMWGGIFFFGIIFLLIALSIWAIKTLGAKMARHQRKMQIETAIRLGMVDAQLQEEVVEDIVRARLKQMGR